MKRIILLSAVLCFGFSEMAMAKKAKSPRKPSSAEDTQVTSPPLSGPGATPPPTTADPQVNQAQVNIQAYLRNNANTTDAELKQLMFNLGGFFALLQHLGEGKDLKLTGSIYSGQFHANLGSTSFQSLVTDSGGDPAEFQSQTSEIIEGPDLLQLQAQLNSLPTEELKNQINEIFKTEKGEIKLKCNQDRGLRRIAGFFVRNLKPGVCVMTIPFSDNTKVVLTWELKLKDKWPESLKGAPNQAKLKFQIVLDAALQNCVASIAESRIQLNDIKNSEVFKQKVAAYQAACTPSASPTQPIVIP